MDAELVRAVLEAVTALHAQSVFILALVRLALQVDFAVAESDVVLDLVDLLN
jgi:hypothetical protein